MGRPSNVSEELWKRALLRAARYCARYAVEAGNRPMNTEAALRSVTLSLTLDLKEKSNGIVRKG